MTNLTALTDTERAGTYDAELRRTGEAVCDANPALYRAIVAEVMSLYRAQPQGYARCVKEVYRRAAWQAGFLVYEEWLAERV